MDATWRLVYLLQKAIDAAASLAPQVPKPVRRLTPTTSPEGSLRPRPPGPAGSNAVDSSERDELCLAF